MIKFKQIHFENAFTVKNLKLNLDDQGLVLITGDNGAAKTAIFETFRHVIFGSTQRGLKGKEIVRDTAKEEGYVCKLSFETNAPHYILQSQNHKKFGTLCQVFRDDKLVSHQRKKLDTQRFIHEEIFKITKEQFDSTILISQEASHPFINATPAEFSRYLVESFGLSYYDDLIEKIKNNAKTAEMKLKEYDALVAVQKSVQSQIDQIPDGFDKSESDGHIRDLTEKLNTLHKLQGALEQNKKHEERRITAEIELRAFGHTDFSTDYMNALIEKTEEKVSNIEDALRALREYNASEAKINTLRQQASIGEDESRRLNELKSLHETYQSIIQETSEKIVQNNAHASFLDTMDETTAECPTCLQRVDPAHLQQHMVLATSALAENKVLNKTLDETKVKLRAVSEEETKIQGKLRKAEAAATAIQHMELPPKPKKDEQFLLTAQAKRESELELLREYVMLLNYTAEAPKESDLNAQILQYEEEKSFALAEHHAGIANEKQRKQLKERLHELSVKLALFEKVKHEESLRKLLIKILQRLKSTQIHGIVNAIQSHISGYLQLVLPGMEIEVETEDAESIERYAVRGSSRIPVRALSKGERAAVRLAAVLAIRKIRQHETSTNVLILDEADGGLDKTAISGFSQILTELSKEFSSVFVITHRSDELDCKFNKHYHMAKRKGISQMQLLSKTKKVDL